MTHLHTSRPLRALLCVLCALLCPPLPAQHPPEDPYVFAYFKEPGTQGIYLALSHDGYTFTPLNDGQPWLKPTAPGEIMRDVFITHDAAGPGFRAVWTWGWKGHSIGYATSPDLLTWSAQREIPLMAAFPGVRNTWAPETYWDPHTQEWVIIWSSSFDSAPAPGIPEGLRIWSTRTRDFTQFTTPTVFFDRGFPVIDATEFHAASEKKGTDLWYLVFKDQTLDPLRYSERWTSGPGPQGPWGDLAALSGPINESWSEGPSVIQIGNKSVVYYDHYRAPRARYEGVETTDWIHWTSVNDRMNFPDAAKHGSFFRITPAEAAALEARHDAPPPAQ